jgi:hypothetical protein
MTAPLPGWERVWPSRRRASTAAPDLRQRAQHRPRPARRGPRQRLVRPDRRAGEEPGVQPGRAHQPLGVLEEPLPGRRRQARRRARRAIDERFGSFDGFRDQFAANALDIKGSGWSILGWDPLGANLLIFQLYDQQGNVPVGITPILMLDMWEHAFYLQYRNVKADYVKAWWNVANWVDAAARFDRARTRTTGLIDQP